MEENAKLLLTVGIPAITILVGILINNRQIEQIDRHVNQQITSLRNEMLSHRNELSARIDSLGDRIDALDSHIGALDRDLRDWAKITMTQNSDIARLKDNAGLG